MSKIELITAAVCPFAQRTHMTLIEKGLEFERREVDLSNKPDWFEEVSPYSKVPVVKIGDQVVWESAVINEFIDEQFPDRPMMPGDPYLRAQARIWIDYCNTRWVDDFYDLLSEREPGKQAVLRGKVIADMRTIEFDGMAKLSDGPFWLGAEVSLIDMTFYPFFERFGMLSHYRDVAIPDDCVRLTRWLNLMRERESVKATMHDDAYYIASYTKYAED
ncbi:MAG: glutathione S-transferase family protein [Alphaproteobacteria bacterium]|jgi:glutathione S-transferase|nr:glutathione S-transferase family protein [Rhodospirillaceae bacterium]MDG2481552.1 glutathione S-transferase family protein [Alphaproteobacteria bacterium]MBT6205201.1 glutathione S-transferase family protein [Rhodospirillaceae bacterium]MBT6512582.1 glutathione S-transferase family protein [Rhodospirillaceae bacterium]MBT7612761.1 glutathione S-transferase family protein [Rhodospirillaceae bacterium]